MLYDTRIDPPSTFAPLEPDYPGDASVSWEVWICYPGDCNPVFEANAHYALSTIVPKSWDVKLLFDDTYQDAPACLFASGMWFYGDDEFIVDYTPQFGHELAKLLEIEVKE